jgi:hypothetical protein
VNSPSEVRVFVEGISIAAGDNDDDGDGGNEAIIEHRWVDGDGVARSISGSGTSVEIEIPGSSNAEAGLELSGPQRVDEGEAVQYQVRLASRPDGSVSVSASLVNEGTRSDISISGGPLLFTRSNWDTEQSLTLNVPRDGVELGDTEVTVRISTSASLIEAYSELERAITVLVTELDAAGLRFLASDSSRLEEEVDVEEDATVTVSMAITSNPRFTVRVPLPSGDYVSLSCVSQSAQCRSGTLTFSTTGTTSIPINVRGLNDNSAAGDNREELVFVAESDDPEYNGRVVTLGVKVIDNDVAGVIIDAPAEVVEGGNVEFSMTLTTRPTEVVVVVLTAGESTTSMSFSPSDWDGSDAGGRFRSFEIEAVRDFMQTGDTLLSLTAVASGQDTNYNGKQTESRVKVVDVDEARLCIRNCEDDDGSGDSVSLTGKATEGGASVTVRVRLATVPSAPVSLRLEGGPGTDDQLQMTEPLQLSTQERGEAVELGVMALADTDREGSVEYEVRSMS